MKKILIIICASIITAIGITTLCLGVINKNFSQLLIDDATIIVLHKDGKLKYEIYQKDDVNNPGVVENIIKLYNEGNENSYLSSIFQGAFSKNAAPAIEERSISNSSMQNLLKDTSSIFIEVRFSSLRKIQLNGKDYTTKDYWDNDITVEYNTVFIEINNASSLAPYTIYFKRSADQNVYNSDYNLTAVGHQNKLYEYLTELVAPGN